MDEYLKKGEVVYNKFCRPVGESRPVMLPRAPQQTFIDDYPDEPGSSSLLRNDKQRQSDYEAEVLVYRALEKLGEYMIVLHGFEYTHHQYRLCDKNHVRKGCSKCKGKAAERDGECDFLIMYWGVFVIIEVKNVQSSDENKKSPEVNKMLKNTLRKSQEQGQKIENLIKCIDGRMEVLLFSAYPNYSCRFQEAFPEESRKSIIFQEDILNFEDWWLKNVAFNRFVMKRRLRFFLDTFEYAFLAELPASSRLEDTVDNILLAIWCTDRDTCNLQRCSLGWCIKDINEKLRTGNFVFRKNNPNNISSSTVVKDYLNVDNMTKQQHDIFCLKDKFLWINGPAGSGKSVILTGRIIELAKRDVCNRILLFRLCGKDNYTMIHQDALKRAEVKYREINLDSFGSNLDYKDVKETIYLSELNEEAMAKRFNKKAVHLSDQISRGKEENPVTIINFTVNSVYNFPLFWLTENMTELSEEYSLFIDDIQSMLSDSFPFDKLKKFLSAKPHSTRNVVYVTCDVAQSWFRFFNYADPFHEFLTKELASSEFHVVHLSKNLRNTFNIAKVLSVMRNLAIELNNIKSDLSLVLPEQTLGHYIHGPKVEVHVLNNFKQNDVTEFLRHELELLCNEEAFQTSDIGLIHDFYYASKTNWTPLIDYALSTLSDEFWRKISLCRIANSPSAEFPAVIVFHEMIKNRYSDHIDDLRVLYLSISRARVYCSIILFPEKGTSVEDHEIYSRMLEKLCDTAHIIRH